LTADDVGGPSVRSLAAVLLRYGLLQLRLRPALGERLSQHILLGAMPDSGESISRLAGNG